MPIAEPDSGPSDPRVYLAAERTLLAWVRTGLAMMGFGFVVARFGLFLRATESLHGVAGPRPQGVSHWAGIALVVLGVGVNLYAAVAHRRTLARLDRGEPIRAGAGSLGFVVAVILALVGVLLATHLVSGESIP